MVCCLSKEHTNNECLGVQCSAQFKKDGIFHSTRPQPKDDSIYRRNFHIDKNNEIWKEHLKNQSRKEHLKMSKIAKFGCEML